MRISEFKDPFTGRRGYYLFTTDHQLGRKDLLLLARTLAHRFSATKKQIARLLGIDPTVLDNAL